MMRLQETEKSAAITLIGLGLIMVFKVPFWFVTRVAAPVQAEFAQHTATFDAGNMTMMIAGASRLFSERWWRAR